MLSAAPSRPGVRAPYRTPAEAAVRWPAEPGTRALALDPLLPQRDRLLDPARVVEAAGRLGLTAGPVTGATRLSVRYRVGWSLDVVWLLHGGRRRHDPAGGPGAGLAGSIVTFRARADDHESRGAAGFDPVLGASWWLLPDDPQLPSAPALLAASPELGAALDLRRWHASAPAGYAPGRWLRVRATDDRGHALADLTGFAARAAWAGPDVGIDIDTLAARHELVARWFDGCDGIATPEVVAHGAGVLGLTAPAGGPTGDGLDAGNRCTRLGEALGHLHDLPVEAAEGLAAPDRRWTTDALEAAAEAVARVRPDTAREVLSLLDRLALRPDDDQPALLHGDPGPGRVVTVASPDHPVLLKGLEHGRTGAPAADLGSALAGMIGRHLADGGSTAGDAAWAAPAEAVIGGYRSRRALPDAAPLRWHAGAALLAVSAHRAVTRLDPAGLRCLPAVVRSAAAVLDGHLLSDHQLTGWA